MALGLRITDEVYDRYVEAFRQAGAGGHHEAPNFSKVAQLMGVTEHTAKRAWVVGWQQPVKRAPISEHFPNQGRVVPRDLRDKPVIYGHDHTYSVSSRSAPDSAAPEVSSDAQQQSAHTVVGNTPAPTHGSSPTPTDYAAALAPVPTMADAVNRLLTGQPKAMIRELESIDINRNNCVGLNIMLGKLIERLMGELPRLLPMEGVQLTVPMFAEAATDLAKIAGVLVTVQEKLMAAQRLLVGAPSVITEHRTTGDGSAPDAPGADERRSRLGPLIGLLARAGAASSYTGEEGGDDVIDVEAKPVNPGQFVGSTGPAQGVRASDVSRAENGNGLTTDPLLSVK